jgi:hypothetical protein
MTTTPEHEPKPAGLPQRAEYFIRRFFERVGGAFDFALRRGGQPRTDLATLAAHLERAIETNLREDAAGVTAPNCFELRYDYETYTRMGAPRREYLERELSANIHEYIYNRRYKTDAEVVVRMAYDAFTRGLEVKADFGAPKSAVMPQNEPLPGQAAAPAAGCRLTLRGIATRWESQAQMASNAEPIGVGRNSGNQLVIKDPSVSNFHAAFVLRADGTLELADRASANGTFVNGVMLESAGRCIVRDGDRLRFGEVEAVVSVTSNY